MAYFSFHYKKKRLEELARESEHNERAFEELYKRLANSAFGYFLRRTSSSQEAEDLTQALFMRIYSALSSYSETEVPFKAWFFRVARNILIDHYRVVSKKRANEIPLDDNFEQKVELSIAEKLDLEKALKALPEKYQDVLHLTFYEELSGKEIAYTLGISENNVRILKFRALKALSKLLKENE